MLLLALKCSRCYHGLGNSIRARTFYPSPHIYLLLYSMLKVLEYYKEIKTFVFLGLPTLFVSCMFHFTTQINE